MTLDQEHLEGLAGFRFALRRFLAASETISRDAGVTPQQYQAMLAIGAKPGEPMSVKELSEQLMLTHHAAVQLVDRLSKAGFAERTRSQVDRRSVELHLTVLGRQVLEQLASLHLEEMLRQEPLLARSLRRLKGMGA
ncbi:MarR family winged helix-turn-helix transcriptional regulator [Caulobacter sp. KR2-114]|uniref:MarR family winged helix-turn-helix transcriptional regulator n=1 Tax=Caulobacter sp. KR2-114 TaxID=3400912 RepID=UPI003C059069